MNLLRFGNAGCRRRKPRAEQDFAIAQYNLGGMYYSAGRGVTQDYAAALNWLLPAR